MHQIVAGKLSSY